MDSTELKSVPLSNQFLPDKRVGYLGCEMLTVLTLLLPIADSVYTDVYNFPMMGILMYDTGGSKSAYGSATIVHKKIALCAAENILQLNPDLGEFITNTRSRKNLYVYAGADLLHPPDWYENEKVKKVKVYQIFLSKDTKWVAAVDEKALKNKDRFVQTFRNSAQRAPDYIIGINAEAALQPGGWQFNPFHELQWDVALLVLESELTWGPYTLPIENFSWSRSQSLVKAYQDAWNTVESIERAPHDFVPCSVPGWSPMGNNEIIYHRVVYVRFGECAEAICGTYPSSCLRYLNNRHHLCFKSLSFADSCVLDQGAPVLCPWYPNKVVGVLTRTFDCGAQTLPSVVTRIDAISVFAAVAQIPPNLERQEPKLDDPTYTENPHI